LKPYFVGFDADCTECGLVVYRDGQIVKAETVEPTYLESWVNDLRALAGSLHDPAHTRVFVFVEMPTISTAYYCSLKAKGEARTAIVFDSGRCSQIAREFVKLCQRAHLGFEVKIIPSDSRIRVDKLALGANRSAIVAGLEGRRRKHKGITDRAYPSKWNITQASLFFPDLKGMKGVNNSEVLDALGLLYFLRV